MKYIIFLSDYMKQADWFSCSEFMLQHVYHGPAYLASVDVCRLPGYTCWHLLQTVDELEELVLKVL